MKLLFLVLLFFVSYLCSTGYPIVEGEISNDILSENGTSINYWLDISNETASNDSSQLDIQEIFQKVIDKLINEINDSKGRFKFLIGEVKDDILAKNGTSIDFLFSVSNETASNDSLPLDMHGYKKKIVDKVKEGIKTVKDKMKDGYNKVKDKIKDLKDKIGSKGGKGVGTGGGNYRDNYDRDYDRDYNRDKYDRDYNRDKYDRDYNRDKYDRDYNRDKYDRDYNRDKYDRDYNRDKYDRDYNRDKYDRDYHRRDRDYRVSSDISESTRTWIGVGLGIFVFFGILLVLYCKVKHGV